MARPLATCSFVLLLACAAFAQTEQQAAQDPALKGSKGVADALRDMIPEDVKTVPLAVTYEDEASGKIIIKINAKNSGIAVPLADVSAFAMAGSFKPAASTSLQTRPLPLFILSNMSHSSMIAFVVFCRGALATLRFATADASAVQHPPTLKVVCHLPAGC
jgi:hypothetical protein